jgi:hypothetical protein
MKELEDVKKAAEEYMKKQIHMLSLMTLLSVNEMTEFRDWFNMALCTARRNLADLCSGDM